MTKTNAAGAIRGALESKFLHEGYDMSRHPIPIGARGICGCRQPVTKLDPSRWVHDAGLVAHLPFAISAVTR